MVKGPARVFVKGPCHALGRNVSWQTVKVRAGKALPFEPNSKCMLQARLGPGARVWWADPRQAGTWMWRVLAQQVSALAERKKSTTFMIIGDTDTGKSTLAMYLANTAISRGFVPSIIDGDIGQGDLAPPTAIGAAVLTTQLVDLRDVNSNNNNIFEFVGSVSPTGFESIVARKLRSILGKTSSQANIRIVNTDGYMRNGGVQYKALVAEELQPDAVIILGEDIDLFDWQHKLASWHILHARPSSQAYKSRLERINRRLDQFFRYVGNGLSVAELSQLKFDYINNLYSPSELFYPPIKQLEPENMKGMFVGLGSDGNIAGFGVIIDVNLSDGTIHTQTNINSFNTIYLSNVRFSSDRIMEIRIT